VRKVQATLGVSLAKTLKQSRSPANNRSYVTMNALKC
jgi:hypothetical protein